MLAIIGGLMAMGIFAANNNPAEENANQFARQITALFNAYREDAVFQNLDFGIAMDHQEILLLSYQDISQQEDIANKDREELDRLSKNPWQPYKNPSLKDGLKVEDEELEMTLFVDEQQVDFAELLEDEKLGPKPALLFLSSDEYTPFVLEINHGADNSFLIRITGDGFSPPLTEIERYEG